MTCKSLLITLGLIMVCSASCAQRDQAPALSAASKTQVDDDRIACEADVKRLCASSRPGAGDSTVLNCLLSHKVELTEACRRNVESHAGSGRGSAVRQSQ